MAYRRSYRKFRRFRKRSTPWYRKKYSASQLAFKAVKGVSYLKGLVNSEKYSQNYDLSGESCTRNGSVTHLTALAQNDNVNQRTGNSVLLKSITFRGQLEWNATDTTSPHVTVRMMLVRDKQQVSDTSIAGSDVNGGAGTATCIYDNMPRTNWGRFQIIKDQRFVLNSPSAQEGNGPTTRLIKWTYRCPGHGTHVRYNGTASTDIQRNGYYLIFFSEVSANQPTVSGQANNYYHDN